MNPALAAIAMAVGAGAVVAVSARDARFALNGLVVALVGSALLADPLPSPATLGTRIVGAILAVAILRASLPEPIRSGDAGSPLGWPAEALIATIAGLGGLAIAIGLSTDTAGSGVPGSALSPSELATSSLIVAVAAALFAVGLTPAALGRSGSRRAIGLVLVAQAAILLRAGLAGAPGDVEQVVIVGLLLGCASAGAALARAAEAPAGSASDLVDEVG